MKRKVVQQGPSTLMISLPSKWAKRHNITKGAELEVTEKPGYLIIGQDRSPKQEASCVFVDAKDLASYVPRFLTMPYLAGHDEIVITYSHKSVADLIQKDVGMLLGFEIIKISENKCHIKNIASGIGQEFDNMINRLNHILISLGSELQEHIEQENYEDMKNLLHREDECNKISLFCRRMFNVQNYTGDKNPYVLYTMVTLIEAAADEYRFIIDYMLKHKPKLNKKTIELFTKVNEISRTFKKLYHSYNHDEFRKFRQARKEIEAELDDYYNLSKHDIYVCNRLYHVMEAVHHMTYF